MTIENIDETLKFFKDIKEFFYNLADIEKKLVADLYSKEGERDDLLHEIELSKLNAIEIMSTYKKLETVLHERRKIKDKINLINTVKPFSNKFILKGICGEADTVIANIETLRNNQENRKYTPRILKDLKCYKGEK